MSRRAKMNNQQLETSISLTDLFNILRKNVILIATVTVFVTVVVGLVTKFVLPKKYASDTTLRVTVAQNDSPTYNDLVTSKTLISDYKEIATSRKVLNKVIKDLQLDMSYKQLKNNISVSQVGDSNIIAITATTNDPHLSKIIAEKVADEFMKEVKIHVKIDTLTMIDNAILNETPVSPKIKLNVIIGFVVGLMLSVGYVLLREFLDSTFKSEEDVTKYLNLPVLASIPVYEKDIYYRV